jgi:AcrR family transcriptional regulator
MAPGGAGKAAPSARFGRPPKVDTHGTPTKERLLDAAVEVCVEFGYEAATLTEIARRADVSTPAIYNHFVDKPDLMVAASRRELDRIRVNNTSSDRLAHATVDQWLDPANATMLTLIVELHMAGARHPDLAALLHTWHLDNAAIQADRDGMTVAQVTVLYLLLMGLAHKDQIDLGASDSAVRDELDKLVRGWLDG